MIINIHSAVNGGNFIEIVTNLKLEGVNAFFLQVEWTQHFLCRRTYHSQTQTAQRSLPKKVHFTIIKL